MIPPRNIVITAVATLLGSVQFSASAATPTTNPADLIRQAADPSAAVAAFVLAAKADPQNTDIELAFVHRMVALAAPELADPQARDLTNRNSADALTRGVCAYMDASRGKASSDIPVLLAALNEQPDNGFLLRTAAQIVAWYDTQNDRSNLSKTDTQGIESLRSKGKGKEGFESAYREAYDARRRFATAPRTTAPVQIPTPPSEMSTSPYDASAVADRYVYPPPMVYAEPSYVPRPYYYYDYWPAGSIIIFRDFDFDHHRHHDNDFQGRFPHRTFGRDWFDRPGVKPPSAPLIPPRDRVTPLPPAAPAPPPPSRMQPPREEARPAPQPARSWSASPPRGGDRGDWRRH